MKKSYIDVKHFYIPYMLSISTFLTSYYCGDIPVIGGFATWLSDVLTDQISSSTLSFSFNIALVLVSLHLIFGRIPKKSEGKTIEIPSTTVYISSFFISILALCSGCIFALALTYTVNNSVTAIPYFGLAFLIALFPLTFMLILDKTYLNYNLSSVSRNINSAVHSRLLGFAYFSLSFYSTLHEIYTIRPW